MTSDSSRISGREFFLIFLFWTSLAVLSSINRMLDPRGYGFRFESPVGPIMMTFVEAWLWAAVTPLVFLLASRFSAGQATWMTRVIVLPLIGLLLGSFLYLVLHLLRMEILPLPTRRRGTLLPFRDLWRLRFINHFVVYCAVLTAGFAREYFLRDRSLQQDAVRLQAQLAEARLEALRSQIHPHFLFNTLHAISALVERDPSGVRRMIARLSDLLRHSLESRGSTEITLHEELRLVDQYAEIMETRFQGRLEVTSSATPETLDARVPNLILQPIIENAFEHGVARAKLEGRVSVTASREEDMLVVAVEDNGPGPGDFRDGIGLANTRARLAQIYGTTASIELREREGGGTRAELRIPWRTGEIPSE